MPNKEKTVFFGPFFGEFGWEASFWHGWVRKMCREKYSRYWKIAASYLGREPFYPDVDEFWPHPLKINSLRISQQGYITDFWLKDFPKGDNQENFDQNISQYAENLLQEYKKKLPIDTIFYTPFKLNAYQLENQWHFFGVYFFKWLLPKVISINSNHQIFEELKPTREGDEFFKKNFNFNRRIIAVFPRCRLARRPDKNWPKEKYDLLIEKLQKRYSNQLIGIFGKPRGAYYADEVPANCLDFINLPERIRFSVQLAALKQVDVAVGSVSGAFRVVLLAGCPVVEWGYGVYKEEAVDKQNFLKTRIIYWPEINPTVETIEGLIKLMMEKKEKETIYLPIPKENLTYNEKKPIFIERVKNYLSVISTEIIIRIFLICLRIKKLKEGTL